MKSLLTCAYLFEFQVFAKKIRGIACKLYLDHKIRVAVWFGMKPFPCVFSLCQK